MNPYNEKQKEFYFGIGKEIVKEGVFERFPELIPAVGNNYYRKDNIHGKMLLIGESNYFIDKDIQESNFNDERKWYLASDAKLIPDYRKKDVSNWIEYKTFNKVFKIMDRMLAVTGAEYSGYLLQEASFYNYFLRPAYKKGSNKGFVPLSIDKEVSGMALSNIIARLSPNLIIFLSKKSYTEFEKFCKCNYIVYENIIVEYVSHPASIWWNRNGGILGKSKFEQLLKDYWINK